MRKTALRRTFTGLLAFAILLAASVSAYTASKKAYQEPNKVVDDETVYVLLDPSGKVLKATVVDWLRAEGKGSLVVEDLKPEKSIALLKNTPEPEEVDGKLRFKVNSNGFSDIYYETETEKDLPLEVKIEYELNGRKVRPESLPGKDGHLKVTITVRNKLKKNIRVDFRDADGSKISKEKEIYVPLFVVATLNLDANRFNNIEVEKGWVSAQGSYFSLSWFAFPQGEEEIFFEADAKDIEIPSMIISAMPRLPQEASLEMKEQFKQLYDALSGLGSLSAAHAEILSKVHDGLSRSDLTNLSKSGEGFSALSKGLGQTSEALQKMSSLVSYQIQLLGGIVNSVDSGNLKDLDKLSYALSQLKSGIVSSGEALIQIKTALEGYNQMILQLKLLNQAAIEELERIETEAAASVSFSNLREILVQQENLLNLMLEGGMTPDGQQVASLDALARGIESMAESLAQISFQIEMLVQQTSQLNQLPANLENLKGTLRVLKEGGTVSGNYLPGLTAVKDGLYKISGAVDRMKEGVDASQKKLSALEGLSDALMRIRTSIELVLNGGYVRGYMLPGMKSSQEHFEKITSGIAVGYEKMQEGEALQNALKEEARKYDTFLGRMDKPNYSGRVRFIMKVQEISSK